MKIQIESWDEVLRLAQADVYLWYKAPLDLKPTQVHVKRIFKNRKMRISGGGVAFTVDAGHLDRFTRMGSPDRPCVGYDGQPFGVGDRVELHRFAGPLTHRSGVVVGIVPTVYDRVRVRLDNSSDELIHAGHECTFRRVS